MQERARPAKPEDVNVLVKLATEAVAEQVDDRGGWLWSRREARLEPFAQSFERALADREQRIWIGEIDSTAVGYCVIGSELLASGDRLGIVRDLYVTPPAREVAVGERLIEAAVSWCKERDCVGIDALALPGNRSTKNFFESFGFKARLLTVHRPLT